MQTDNITKVTEFVSFCIEMYAMKHNLSGAVVASRLSDAGLVDYLYDNYEALHTQGTGYIVPLLDELLAGKAVCS